MTEKLYYKDSYIKECESEVIDVINENNKILVVLNKTPFYPEGGGQPSDIGTIDGVKVTYVYEKGDIIYHQVEKEVTIGKVQCIVDFQRRFDYMQQHSGEHLLSGVIYDLYKGNNKGFHLGEDYVTIDIDIKSMSEEMLIKVENIVNSYIYKNEQFKTYTVNNDEMNNVPSRKRIKVQGDIRIVEAKGMDCCPCCGTHVNRTGEIGIVKILKAENYKGVTRIYLKCGKRAFEDFKIKHELVTLLGRKLSTDEYGIMQRVDKYIEEINELKKELVILKNNSAKEKAEKLLKDVSENLIFKSYEDKTFDEVQLIGEVLMNKNYIFVLTSLKENKILFVNDLNESISCGKLFKEHIRRFNGKGGGKDKRAQGSFEEKEDLIKFSEFLCNCIKEQI